MTKDAKKQLVIKESCVSKLTLESMRTSILQGGGYNCGETGCEPGGQNDPGINAG